MSIPLGEDAIIHTGATSTPTTPVNWINSYTAPRSRPETKRPYYMSAKQTFVGESEDTYQLQGDEDLADAGQQVLRDAYDSGDPVFLKILPDGTNGWKQQCRVSQHESRGPSPDDPPGVTFNLVGIAARVAIP